MSQKELHEKMQTIIDITESILIEAKNVGSSIEDPKDYFDLMETAIKFHRAYENLVDPMINLNYYLTKFGES